MRGREKSDKKVIIELDDEIIAIKIMASKTV